MLDEYTRERLAGWVADVGGSDALAGLPPVVAEHAEPVLETLLLAACERGGADPGELSLADLRAALLSTVARLQLPAEVHRHVPDLCRDALAELQAQGRLAGGRDLGLALAAGRDAYARAVAGEVEPLTRPGEKIGRNDPCPCGSGRKYKACCLRR